MTRKDGSSLDLHKLTEAELRMACKSAIESLEFWLRRVIDIALRPEFGEDYMNAQNPADGQYVFKKSLREKISTRVCRDPKRYPRNIDAALLEDEMYIVCHRQLYAKYFKPFFSFSYPLGSDELRFFLGKIAVPRNPLAHSNPISVRQAEQAICYSHDVIDAIKKHLEILNMGKDFNAPTIVKIFDSNGSGFHDAQIKRNSTGGGGVNLSEDSPNWLRVGDTLSVEVEVDPSFSPDDYRIEWVYENQAPEHTGPLGNRITIDILECHVGFEFAIYCMVTSNQSWHRCGDVDDCVSLIYKVLPRG